MGASRYQHSHILTCDECRAVDRYAIETLGIPGIVLMENAGRNAADLIERWARRSSLSRSPDTQSGPLICIACGKGNNGGDGFVIARQLFNRGWTVAVDLAADPATLTGDAAINYAIIERIGITIRPVLNAAALEQASMRWRHAVIMVDALLGTGFSGEVREPLADIIQRMNAAASPTPGETTHPSPLLVAIDVPSGLNADTGTASGMAVRAHRTITFLAKKVGYQNKNARAYLGRVTVCDIGAPLDLIRQRWEHVTSGGSGCNAQTL